MKRFLFVLLAAGCGRDLALPARVDAPAVASFAPAQAFAGETVTIQGSNFDPVARRNVVHFGAVAAEADSVGSDGSLTVTVPDDAGSGRIAVANVSGLGAPSAASFSYRGIGHLRRGQLLASLPALHRPCCVVAFDGDVWLASSLFRLFQSHGGLFAKVDHKANAAVSDGALLYATVDDPVDHFLYAFAPAALGTPKVVTLGFSPRALAVGTDATGTVLVVAGDDGNGTAMLAAYRADLSTLFAPRPVAGSTVLGAAASSDGSTAALVVQARGGAGLGGTVTQVVLAGVSTGKDTVVAPTGKKNATGAVAWTPNSSFVVGFDDGTVDELAGGAWTQSMSTLSRTPVGSLLAYRDPAQNQRLAVSKPADGSVLFFDMVNSPAALRGGAQVRGQPDRLAFDGKLLYAADAEGNGVDALDANGFWLNRVPFDIGLGNADGAACGAAYDPAPLDGAAPRFLVVARNTQALLAVDAGSLQFPKPLSLVRGGATPPVCVGVAPDGNIWVLHQQELGIIVPLDGNGKKVDKEKILSTGFPVAPTGLAFTPDGLPIVRFPSGAAVLGRDGQTLAGLVLDASGQLDMLSVQGAQVYASWTTPGAQPVPHVAFWNLADFLRNGNAAARWDDASGTAGYSGTTIVGSRALVFYSSRTAQPSAESGSVTPLDLTLAPQPQEAAPLRAQGPIAVAPDNRYFVWTRLKVNPDFVLHHTRALAGQGIVHTADLQLSSPLQGAAFDATGERLAVPTATGDVVQVYE